jgi:hypothetical protein
MQKFKQVNLEEKYENKENISSNHTPLKKLSGSTLTSKSKGSNNRSTHRSPLSDITPT